MGVVVHRGGESSIRRRDRRPLSRLHREVRIGRVDGEMLAGHAGQQHRGALLCEQSEDPFDRQGNAVFPAWNQHQVNKRPEQPADASGKLQATQISDGRGSIQHRHAAEIEVIEGRA